MNVLLTTNTIAFNEWDSSGWMRIILFFIFCIILIAAIILLTVYYYRQIKYKPGCGIKKVFDTYSMNYLPKKTVKARARCEIEGKVMHIRIISSSFTTQDRVVKGRYTIEYYVA